MNKPTTRTFTTAVKAQAERKALAAQELAARLSAKNILAPDDVAGAYDSKRVLMTALGGSIRPITQSDLTQFQKLSNQLGKKFKGGITAKQIIDLSMPDRRRRAHDEIRTAAPIANSGGVVRFQTNAGPNSKVSRHYVTVEFMAYDAVVASPLSVERGVKEMLAGKIKIDCDCEDTRYMFRYIQTVAKVNAGRPETGFPKLKNAKLKGIACKHTLRVMALITQSPTFKAWAAKMIERGRATLSSRQQTVKVEDAKKFAEAMAKESWRQRAVRTTDEKRRALPARAAAGIAKGLAGKRPAEQLAAKTKEAARRGMERQIARLKQLGMSPKEIADLAAAMARAMEKT